ncbi:MAG: hypothetical protein HY896_08675 [Deltaproteobacteria bacterium]|nr:hypothetical protein [Deltaproteobacteria bacterium]
MRSRRRGGYAGIIGFCLLVFAAVSHGEPVDDLCRIHGVASQENIVRIGEAYAAARRSGIPEEELLPFFEDILKHKLDCPQMVRILSVATKLRETGLPYYVVFSKVREGVAKEAAPALVVEAAESKLKTLYESRDVLTSLEAGEYRVLDYKNAAVIVSSYIEKGYTPGEIVTRIRRKGIKGAGFAALAEVVERKVKRKEH